MTLQFSASASQPASRFDDPPAIDLVHLSRQTLGDRQLETELLGLFAKQAKTIVKALAKPAEPGRAGCDTAADLLHRLCGSARAIGSWGVAAQAEGLERDLRARAGAGFGDAQDGKLVALARSVEQACAAIDDLLDGDSD